jgi:hypothetical protein
MTQVDLDELLFILLGSLTLTLCIEMPVKNLRKMFLKDKTLKECQKIACKME